MSDDSSARGETQLHRICIASRARLHEAELGQLLQPLSGQDLDDSRIAYPVALPHELECRVRGGQRFLLALQRIRIVFQAVEGISDLSKRGEHGLLVVGKCRSI